MILHSWPFMGFLGFSWFTCFFMVIPPIFFMVLPDFEFRFFKASLIINSFPCFLMGFFVGFFLQIMDGYGSDMPRLPSLVFFKMYGVYLLFICLIKSNYIKKEVSEARA